MTETTLYQRLGGYDAIAAVADDLLARPKADPQLARFWAHRGNDGLRREQQLLVDFLCSSAGGPLAPDEGREVLDGRLLDEGGHQPLAQKGPCRVSIGRGPPARERAAEDPLLQPGEETDEAEGVSAGGEELVPQAEAAGPEEVPPEPCDLLFLGVPGLPALRSFRQSRRRQRRVGRPPHARPAVARESRRPPGVQ